VARPRHGAWLALAGVALAGCGSLTVHELPPAAEPARSPGPLVAPAGRVVPVGTGAEGVAVDPRSGRVAVAVRDPPALAFVDERSGRIVRRVALPGAARHLARASDGFVVPAEGAGRLLVVAPGGAVRGDVPAGAQPHDAAAVAGRVFVGDERGNALAMLAGSPLRALRASPGATPPGGAPAAGRDVAVVSVRERVLELYDARTLERAGRAGAGIGPTHVVAFGSRLYVTDTQGGALLVFVRRPRLELVRRVFLAGAPYGIAVDPVRRRLWVTLTARNELVELPAHGRPHPLRRFATVRQPDSVAVDVRSGRVFVTGRSAGVLQIVTP
jgi:DNA-binding beta-propeller fold protein YncE